ncbi:hypothetical protein RQP46_003409 [Phenoliferia psychrophenolica]
MARAPVSLLTSHDAMNDTGEPLSPDKVAALLRRWNHQVDHLALAKGLPPHRFDLQTSPDQSFSATRLRSNLERFFLVFANLRSAGREFYVVAWLSPIGVFHALVLVLIAFILSPAFRVLLFPPLAPDPVTPPPPITSEEDTGGSEPLDPFCPSLTAEEEREMAARDFTDGMTELATLGSSRTSDDGESENGATDGDTDAEESGADPVTVEIEVEEARTGRGKRHRFKKAKVTRVARVERVGLPIMRTSGRIADMWEKWANGLSPPAPFPADVARVRMVRYLLPIPLLGIIFSPGTIMSILSFTIGFAFFGQPLFGLVGEILDKATDRVRVATTKFDFSERMRQRETRKEEASASNFFAHRGGVPGHLILVPPTAKKKGEAVWTLAFVRVAASSTSASESSTRSFTNLSIPITSITSLKKISGLGWKGKMAYEFLVGADKATMGGIKISWSGRNGEATSESFRTIPRRDELFNRLVGLSSTQRFESL